MRTRVARVLGLAVVWSLLVVAPAQAYIDPGSTTVIFQAVIAGFAAAGVAIATFWSRITGFFRRSPSGEVDLSDLDTSAPEDAAERGESATADA